MCLCSLKLIIGLSPGVAWEMAEGIAAEVSSISSHLYLGFESSLSTLPTHSTDCQARPVQIGMQAAFTAPCPAQQLLPALSCGGASCCLTFPRSI